MNRAMVGKILWVIGGILVGCIVDLAMMFWNRSKLGGQFGQSAWGAGALGKGRYNLLPGQNSFKKPNYTKQNWPGQSYPKKDPF